MKIKKNKDIIWLICIIPLFLWVAFSISSRMEDKIPAYSVINKSTRGYSVFYKALKELKYPVSRTLKSLEYHETTSVQIVAADNEFDVSNDNVKVWIEKGGILVYLTPETLYKLDYGESIEDQDGIAYYKYGKGVIITCDINDISNKTLIKNTTNAYNLISKIDANSYKKIYFNEHYLFSKASQKSLWDYIPLQFKFIIYQMVIVILAFLYYKGKRFGKPALLHEEVERSENEYLYSTANLYRQCKCTDLMVESYYKDFLNKIKGNKDNWIEYWTSEKFEGEDKAKRLYDFMNFNNKKVSEKEYMEIIAVIEHLNGIIEKRRDLHWKTLK